MTTDNRICRLCDENNDHLYNIFEKNVFDIQIINMIKDCIPIVIYRKDPLSKYICHSCNENLNMFVEFKKTCLETANKHKEELQLLQSSDPAIELYLKQMEEVTLDVQNVITDETNEEDSKTQNFASLPSENSMDYEPMQNETGESEMDLDDTMTSDTTFNAAVSATHVNQSAITHKPRISGPKSLTNSYKKIDEIEEIVYQPVTLLEIIVHHINNINIPDYNFPHWIEEVKIVQKVRYCCRYCEEIFVSEIKLAEHESVNHIQLILEKVDEGPSWNRSRDCFNIRNEWMKSQNTDGSLNDEKKESEEEGAEETESKELLMPIKDEEEKTLDVSRNSIIYFVGEVPYANGTPLEDIPKETRNSFYQSVRMQGLRRKFCQLCRYTFKDNWSIDTHYFKSNCYFTCNYCGAKFKRSKHEFLPHIREHQLAGHEKSMSVFASNDRGDIIEYDTSCLEIYVPVVNQYAPRQMKILPPKPTPMKLRVRSSIPKTEPEDYSLAAPVKLYIPQVEKQISDANKLNANSDLARNQAYFCKKCYQVFTKLDSYNLHMKTCNGEIIDDPEMSLIRHYNKKDGSSPLFCSKVKPSTQYRKNVTKRMPPLNPLPQGVKIKQEKPENGTSQSSGNSNPIGIFPCTICDAVFQTVYSRNSHMRIHVKHKQQMALQQQQQQSQKRAGLTIASPAPKKIKHESFEPIVEIHEGSSKVPSIIGSVSITPIKRVSNGGTLNVNPDIMKLVQNNPNITFGPRERRRDSENAQSSSAMHNTSPSGDESDFKTYKCSSCTLHFANKSNLYFHKKNQCTGSRYPCPFCKKRFGTATEYSSHIYYSHPE